MPGVDGNLSTRMIRFLEKEQALAEHYSSVSNPNEAQIGKSNHRVPIFAVSASLYEDRRFEYLQSGYVSPSSYGVVRRHPLIVIQIRRLDS
jgi:hypothetical protein